MKNTRETLGMPKVTGTIKTGPFGLIEIQTETGRIYVNCNGFFFPDGEKITTGKAKAIVGLA